MRASILAMAALLGSALLAPVSAADVYGGETGLKDNPDFRPAISWTGFYVGVHGGYGWGAWEGTPEYDDGTGVFPGLFDPGEVDGEGFFGGVTVGANKQLGGLVIGLEADGSWGDFGGENIFDATGASTGYRWKVEQELKNLGTVRGRLGWALGPVLLYGTGGIAFAQTEANETVHCGGNQCNPARVTAVASAEENHIGWVAGAGAEWMIGDGWSLKGEWLHVDLGEAEYRFKGTAYPGTLDLSHTTDSFGSSLEMDILRAGLNYRF